jgi:hypothetical protein
VVVAAGRRGGPRRAGELDQLLDLRRRFRGVTVLLRVLIMLLRVLIMLLRVLIMLLRVPIML